jgi:hypothetical protein
MKVYFLEEHKICKFCGRKFTREDAIKIKKDQGYNHFGKLHWGKHRVFCGEWCSRLYAKIVVRKSYTYQSSRNYHFPDTLTMISYARKYGNWEEKTIMLKDISYLG